MPAPCPAAPIIPWQQPWAPSPSALNSPACCSPYTSQAPPGHRPSCAGPGQGSSEAQSGELLDLVPAGGAPGTHGGFSGASQTPRAYGPMAPSALLQLQSSCSAGTCCADPSRAVGLACGSEAPVALFLSASLSFVPWVGILGVLAASCQTLPHSHSAAPAEESPSKCCSLCIISILLPLLVLQPPL